MVVLAAPLVLVAGGVVAYAKLSDHPPAVPVPDVRNQDVFTSAGLAKRAGFEISSHFEDSPRPGGIVLSQHPAVGHDLERGSTITVAVSSMDATVPDVTTLGVADAKVVLAKRGLGNITVIPDYRDDVDAGTVTRTNPVAYQRVAKANPFELVVAADPHVKVPDVRSKDQASATSALQGFGLQVAVETASSSTVPAGVVIKTSPSADRTAVRGDTVTLTVSSGPKQVNVPPVVGKSRDDAVSQLEDGGFAVNVVTATATGSGQVGRVIAQDPSGGKVSQGSTVTITVGVRKG
jgi:serine/threonine-protein kinase